MKTVTNQVAGAAQEASGAADVRPDLEADAVQRAAAEKRTRGAMAGDDVPNYLPLDQETRVAVDTGAAAHHLNRQPQTLRAWACRQDGPLRPVRMHGRLAWRTADLRRLLGVE